MHFSKIYIQENFVPNVVQDQFGRKVIGTEVFLNQDDDIEKGRELAEQYIKEYIQKNTVYPDHNHIEIKVIPDIQIEKEETKALDKLITESQTIEELESWKIISMSNNNLKKAYILRKSELLRQSKTTTK